MYEEFFRIIFGIWKSVGYCQYYNGEIWVVKYGWNIGFRWGRVRYEFGMVNRD